MATHTLRLNAHDPKEATDWNEGTGDDVVLTVKDTVSQGNLYLLLTKLRQRILEIDPPARAG